MEEDRRKAARHPVQLSIAFDNGAGLTRDISGLGVLFETEVELAVGDDIEFTMPIPDAAEVRCRGRVVRVRRERETFYSVGATIERFKRIGGSSNTHAILADLELHHPNGWEWGE